MCVSSPAAVPLHLPSLHAWLRLHPQQLCLLTSAKSYNRGMRA